MGFVDSSVSYKKNGDEFFASVFLVMSSEYLLHFLSLHGVGLTIAEDENLTVTKN